MSLDQILRSFHSTMLLSGLSLAVLGSCGGAGKEEGDVSYSATMPQPRTAVETWDGLRTAFQRNNLEAAVEYFAPHVQDMYKDVLSHVNLQKVGAAMPTLTETVSANQFSQYEFEYAGKKYAVTMNCEHDICQIIGL